MSWRRFAGADDKWDSMVTRLGMTTPFQFSAWADFRSTFGWRTLRLVTDDGNCAAQLLMKSIGPMRIVWGAGAPLGATSTSLLVELAEAARREVGGSVSYLRVADHRQVDNACRDEYRHAGFVRPARLLSTDQTLVRNLSSDHATLAETYTSNWSRNLRRGHQREVGANEWTSPDAAQLARLHQDVENLKHSFHADWRRDEDSMRRLLECFGGRLVVVRATDAHGALLAARAAVVCGTTGFDFLAATAPEGRRCYASNVALDALLSLIAARGITRYDFGGVDQTNNKGVFDFKHGAGGIPYSYVGEFEFVSPRMARGAVSKLVSLRLSA
jgi:hypothetical protein